MPLSKVLNYVFALFMVPQFQSFQKVSQYLPRVKLGINGTMVARGNIVSLYNA